MEYDKNKYNQQYKKDHFERISFVMPIGTKEQIKNAAEKLGISQSEFIRQAIAEKISK